MGLVDQQSGSLEASGSFWTRTLRQQDRPAAHACARTAWSLPHVSGSTAILQAHLTGHCVPAMQAWDIDAGKIMAINAPSTSRVVTNDIVVVRKSTVDEWEAGGFFATALEAVEGSLTLMAADGSQEYLMLPGGTPKTRADWLKTESWVVPSDTWPDAIRTDQRCLLAGIDFFRSGPDTLAFREHPAATLTSGHGVAAGLHFPASTSCSQALGVDGPVPVPVWRWARGAAQGPAAFQAAVAAAAGLVVPEEDLTVAASWRLQEGGYRYLCTPDWQVIDVPYLHDEVTKGSLLPALQPIGSGLRVYAGEPATRWYRQLDWSDGLSLDTLCPVTGITVPDREVPVWLDSGQLRIGLEGTDQALAAFWDHVDRQQERCATEMADLFPDLDGAEVTTVNALDFVMSMTGDQIMVVALDPAYVSASARARALQFIDREKPSCYAVLIREP